MAWRDRRGWRSMAKHLEINAAAVIFSRIRYGNISWRGKRIIEASSIA